MLEQELDRRAAAVGGHRRSCADLQGAGDADFVAAFFDGFAVLGAVIGVGGVSALLGALISERIARRLGIGPAISAAVVMIGSMGLLLPLAYGVFAVPMLILGQAGDAAWSIYLINELTVRQSATPNRLLGRVNASMQFLAAGAVPLGAIAGGLLAEAFGLRTAMAVGVGMILCGCVWVLRSPLPRLRELPVVVEEMNRREQ